MFNNAAFYGDASFESAKFEATTSFNNAVFECDARFQALTFPKDVFFNGAMFGPGCADFALSTFERVAQFDGVAFSGEADFNAVFGKRTFSMADASFGRVPNFIQAHFEEAPRLDNVHFAPPRSELLTDDARRDQLSRWRALKRLAIEAHDIDRELEFNAQEINAARSFSNWPIPVRLFEPRKWFEASRSLSGFFYWAFSDYGRSVLLPIGWWALTVLIATDYYLGQHDEVAANRTRLQREGYSVVGAYLSAHYNAWESGQACFSVPREGKNGRVALNEDIAKETNAPWEALQLAFRNGALVLDGGSEAAHRTYGCLYGFELFGTSRTVYVPLGVSIASAIQKLFSAVFIFLFGLALRNMLKVK